MSIVKPKGRVMTRITIEVDDKGQAEVRAENLAIQLVVGSPQPVPVINIVQILTSVTANMVYAMMRPPSGGNNHAPQAG